MGSGKQPIEANTRVRRALVALGWTPGSDAEEWLRTHVRSTIEKWISAAASMGIAIMRPADVLRLVAERLRVQLVEIESDEELRKHVRTYCARGELAFGTLEEELNGGVEAAIVRLKQAEPWERPLVALIDARGQRGAARFFGSCHEVGHPFLEPQLSFGFRCRASSKDALERAVDIIAGEVAFHAPLAEPILRQYARGDLTWMAVERFWNVAAPGASRTAAFSAAVRLWTEPAILVTATVRCAKHGLDDGVPDLRVESTVRNTAAVRHGIHIPKFRVPPASAIRRAYDDTRCQVQNGSEESLGAWHSSDGTVLHARPVRIDAKRVHERVFALLRF
jgi:hypothetical protein